MYFQEFIQLGGLQERQLGNVVDYGVQLVGICLSGAVRFRDGERLGGEERRSSPGETPPLENRSMNRGTIRGIQLGYRALPGSAGL